MKHELKILIDADGKTNLPVVQYTASLGESPSESDILTLANQMASRVHDTYTLKSWVLYAYVGGAELDSGSF